MSIITKSTLIATLLVSLAPAALAREGGTQPDLPMYNGPIAQRGVYTDGPRAWSQPNNAGSAYAQQRGHFTSHYSRPNRVFRDDPPGSAFQDWGQRESQ
jgi:hypothetical protein